MEELKIPLLELKNFVKEAKDNCWASEKGVKEVIVDGFKVLRYPALGWKKARRRYQDRYTGYDISIGEECVWYKDIPVWIMNYCGFKTDSNVDSKLTFDFLREALRNCSAEMPIRGPEKYVSKIFDFKGFEYILNLHGDFTKFQGWEVILYQANDVFTQWLHGGVPEHKKIK